MPTIDYTDAGGASLPGVTTVLQGLGWKTPVLMKYAHRLGRDGQTLEGHRDAAMLAGTVAHSLIGARLGVADGVPDCDEDVMGRALVALAHWDAWRESADIAEVLAAEVPLVSRDLRCGGCPDLVYRDGSGRVWIADWKTSETGGSVYKEHRIQLAAYQMIWDELRPEAPIHGIRVVPLPTTTKQSGGLRKVSDRTWTAKELGPDRTVFCALRVIYDQAGLITTTQKERAPA
jgi:hypothetical protein